MPENLMPLGDAVVLTSFFRQENKSVLDPSYQDKDIFATCETFNRELFDTLLSYPECTGIRVYSGMDPDKLQRFIVVGVNSNDEDIYITQEETPGALFVIENGARCPILCPPESELNT